QRILNEAIIELKESEPHLLRQEEKTDPVREKPIQTKLFVSDFQIDTDLEIMFPDEYISNISERIRLYKELNDIENEEELQLYEKRLTDRFGPLPAPSSALLDVVRIKWSAIKLGIEKILLKNNLLIANFISDPESQFYKSQLFVSIMNYVNHHQRQMSVKQKEAKLSLTIRDITSVKAAILVLNNILVGTIVPKN
ncbi:MAG: transcription-repair coupling factor, partial [Bacteroidia bacterium]|nr:transcription-repair coupling factor [Bacteroidia bacterium]